MIGTPDGVNVSTLMEDPKGPIATFSAMSSILASRQRGRGHRSLGWFSVVMSPAGDGATEPINPGSSPFTLSASTRYSASTCFLNPSDISSHTNRSTENGRSLSSNASRRSATRAPCSGRANATRSRSDSGREVHRTREP